MKDTENRELLAYFICVLIYFLTQYVSNNPNVLEIIVVVILFSLVIGISVAVRKKIRIFLCLLGIVGILLFLNQVPGIYMFLPVFLIRFLLETGGINSAIIGIISVFLMREENAGVFLLIYTTCFVFEKYVTRGEEKFNKQKIKEIELEKTNMKLRRKIEMNTSLQKEIDFNIRLDERSRLSQKLHDMLGHSLSGALMQIEASKLIMRDKPDEGMKLLDSSTGIIRTGIDSIRAVLRENKPGVYEVGISEIKTLLKKVENENSLKTNLMVSGDSSFVDIDIMSAIYSITEEALSNTIKHSGAENFTVFISVFKKLIKLTVEDDGRGALKINENMGLSGIRDRVVRLGGSLNIDASDGFKINALFPVNDKEKNK